MNNNNKFIITLPHDIGRRHVIKPFKININASWWNGVDKKEYDKHKILTKLHTKASATLGCSQAIINLFEHIITNKLVEKYQYFVIFEDDVVLHNNFFNYWKKVNNFMKTTKNWKIIFLGVSIKIQSNSSSFQIMNYPKNQMHSGGFGVILHSSIIKEVLDFINLDPTQPHDITAYGKICSKYPNECYVCIPNLVIADIRTSNIRESKDIDYYSKKVNWKLIDYKFPKQIPMFIITNNNIKRIENILTILSPLRPKVRPVFIKLKDDSLSHNITLTKINENNVEVIVSCLDEVMGKIKEYCKINNNSYNYFILTTIYINWKFHFSPNFLDTLNEKMVNYDYVKGVIRKCPRCNNNSSVIHNLNIYQGFGVMKLCKIKKMDYLDIGFYSTNSCSELSDNFHSLSYYDLIDDIEKNNIRSFPSLFEYNKEKWIMFFKQWVKHYLESIINKIIRQKVNIEDKIVLKNSFRKLFNSPEFRVYKLGCSFNRDNLVISFGQLELTYLFGLDNTNKLKSIIGNLDNKLTITFENACHQPSI